MNFSNLYLKVYGTPSVGKETRMQEIASDLKPIVDQLEKKGRDGV